MTESQESNEEPTALAKFELMDRCAMLGDNLESNLANHPALMHNPEAYHLVMNASERLAEAYSLLAQDYWKARDEEKRSS